jgi:hypothetical protein
MSLTGIQHLVILLESPFDPLNVGGRPSQFSSRSPLLLLDFAGHSALRRFQILLFRALLARWRREVDDSKAQVQDQDDSTTMTFMAQWKYLYCRSDRFQLAWWQFNQDTDLDGTPSASTQD